MRATIVKVARRMKGWITGASSRLSTVRISQGCHSFRHPGCGLLKLTSMQFQQGVFSTPQRPTVGRAVDDDASCPPLLPSTMAPPLAAEDASEPGSVAVSVSSLFRSVHYRPGGTGARRRVGDQPSMNASQRRRTQPSASSTDLSRPVLPVRLITPACSVRPGEGGIQPWSTCSAAQLTLPSRATARTNAATS